MNRRWTAACLQLGLVLAGLLAAAPARALPAELEYAKGVVAFSRGDLRQAERHFQAVLAEQPDHPQATYYLGQVALGLGQLERARRLFGRAIQLQPDNPAVRLDLALALIQAGRFARAERELTAAAPLLGERASLLYYLGFCRYRQGHFRQALEPLERAQQLDDGFAASAAYYRGLALYQLGQQAEAERQFEQLASASDGSLAGLARENLAVMAGQERSGGLGWWGLVATLGAGYDSNVTLESDGTAAAGAPTTFLSVSGWLIPLRTEHDALDLSAQVYRSFFFDLGDRSVDGLDLTDVAAALRYRHVFGSGQRLELAYLFDLDLLDDLQRATGLPGAAGFGVYMHGHSAAVRWLIPEGRFAQTALSYRFHSQYFWPHDDSLPEYDRDNFGHRVSLRQEIGLAAGRLRLGLEVAGLYQDARARAWDLWGLGVSADGRFAVVGPLSGWLQLGWLREDHFRSAATYYRGQRVDDRWGAAIGLSWRFSGHLSVGLSYRYLNNDSNGVRRQDPDDPDRLIPSDFFDYQRHLVNVALVGRL